MAGVTVAARQTPTPPGTTASVEGRVVDAGTGRPLAGVVVQARPSGSGRTSSAVFTTADGRFRLGSLTAGNWQIVASRPDYFDGGYGKERERGLVTSFSLANGQHASDLLIRMWAPGFVSGRVVDEQDEPIVGATVTAFPTQLFRFDESAQTQVGGTTTTNDRGEYEIRVRPGEYVVAVPVMHLTWPIGTYADRRGGMVVFDRAQRGLPAFPSQDGRFHLRLANGLTPSPLADGRPGTFVTTFHPSATTFSDATVLRVSAGENRTGIDIRAVRQPRIRVDGIAVGPSGPLKQVVLRLTPRDWPAPLGEAIYSSSGRQLELGAPQVTTHDDGTFTFMSAPAGDYTLTAYRQLRDADVVLPDLEGFWEVMSVSFDNRGLSNLVVTLKPGFSVSGHYEVEGPPPPPQQVSVRLERLHADGFGGGSQRVEPGRFQLKGVLPGRYVVRTNLPVGWFMKSATRGGRDVADEPIDISADIADLVVTISNRAAQVTGVVTSSEGAAARDAAVVLFPVEPARRIPTSRSPRTMQQVRPGVDGQYVLRGLPPGDYFLAAVKESAMDTWPDTRFLDGLMATAVRLSLADGETRSVPLTLGSGR
jgi:hypothetical protein